MAQNRDCTNNRGTADASATHNNRHVEAVWPGPLTGSMSTKNSRKEDQPPVVHKASLLYPQN